MAYQHKFEGFKALIEQHYPHATWTQLSDQKRLNLGDAIAIFYPTSGNITIQGKEGEYKNFLLNQKTEVERESSAKIMESAAVEKSRLQEVINNNHQSNQVIVSQLSQSVYSLIEDNKKIHEQFNQLSLAHQKLQEQFQEACTQNQQLWVEIHVMKNRENEQMQYIKELYSLMNRPAPTFS
jgi:histone acetyltransferase (RNA polymerase elongator complex component)